MTPQEAIKTFKTVVVYAPEKYENKYYKAIMLAIEALEKQIPKKAKNITTTVYYKQGRCPNCNALLKNTINIFCPDCGQALDWSDN